MQTLRTLTFCVASLAFTGFASAQTVANAAVATSAKQGSKPVAKVAAAPSAAATPPAADGEQLMAASLTLFGAYQCEYNQTVTVSKHPTADGYVNVAHAGQVFTMKPVRSMTGAVRLEQVSGGMLMVQIPSKSMLMDTKIGKRVVDGCKHEEQRKEVDTANSLGINAPGQVVVGGAAPAQPRR